MVHPVEAPEQSPTDLVDTHPGACALAVSRRSYTIEEKRELVQAYARICPRVLLSAKRAPYSDCLTSIITASKRR